MPTKRLATRLDRLATQVAAHAGRQGAPVVVLLLGDRDPATLTAEEKARLAWEQHGVVIGPQTQVVLFVRRSDGPQ